MDFYKQWIVTTRSNDKKLRTTLKSFFHNNALWQKLVPACHLEVATASSASKNRKWIIYINFGIIFNETPSYRLLLYLPATPTNFLQQKLAHNKNTVLTAKWTLAIAMPRAKRALASSWNKRKRLSQSRSTLRNNNKAPGQSDVPKRTCNRKGLAMTILARKKWSTLRNVSRHPMQKKRVRWISTWHRKCFEGKNTTIRICQTFWCTMQACA